MTHCYKYFFLFIFFSCFHQSISAQKIFQIEKFGSTDVVRFYIGSTVTFKLADTDQWFTRTIEDIVAEENLILFTETGFVNIKDITAIQKTVAKGKWKAYASSLYLFGVQWGFWSVAGTLLGEPLTWLAAIVPATAFTIGFLIQTFARSKIWKIGKRRRLRVLNLNIGL